jgi:hypothetical protein
MKFLKRWIFFEKSYYLGNLKSEKLQTEGEIKMKVYKLNNHLKSMDLAAVKDRNHPINSDFNGEPKAHYWKPVRVETLYKKNI